MFKPEYILDNVAVFGLEDTVTLIKNKFMRMGKSKAIADTMARQLVNNTVFVADPQTV